MRYFSKPRLINAMVYDSLRRHPAEHLLQLEALHKHGELDEPLHGIPAVRNFIHEAWSVRSTESFLPASVLDFVREFLSDRTAKAVLDPAAGLGQMISEAQTATAATRAVAYVSSMDLIDVAKAVSPKIEWHPGHWDADSQTVDDMFDVVVSALPLGAKTSTIQRRQNYSYVEKGHTFRDLGFDLLVQSSKAMIDSGVGIFVTTPNFFWLRDSPYRRMDDFGLGIQVAILIPAGSLEPLTSIPTYLVVINKQPSPSLFVGELTGSTSLNKRLLENLKAYRSGDSIEQGWIVDCSEFYGIEQLRVSEQVKDEEKRIGAEARSLGELITRLVSGKRSADFEFDDIQNAVYIPTVGNSDVVTSPTELNLKPQNYIQLEIDPTKSNARFIAHFLNTELGRAIRESNKRGTTIGHISQASLTALDVFVPPIETQRQMLEVQTRINAARNILLGLQSDLSAYEAGLWASSRQWGKVNHQIDVLSNKLTVALQDEAEESVKDWIDTLPFPLASILWEWQRTLERNVKDRYQLLLHFFEAAVAFHTILLLSALGAEGNIRNGLRATLLKTLGGQPGRLKQPTFGTWRTVFEALAKETRRYMSGDGDGRQLCARLLVDPSLALPKAVAHQSLNEVFQKANAIRNKDAHGGVVGYDLANSRHEELRLLLNGYRRVTAGGWSNVNLVRVLASNPWDEAYSDADMAILMGKDDRFETHSQRIPDLMYRNRLYMFNRESAQRFSLLPLLEMGRSPEVHDNAVYFYNGMDGEGSSYKSYHYDQLPELHSPVVSLAALTGGWFE